MELNIQDTKIELIQWLTTLEDRSLIQKLVDLRNNDWWNTLSSAEKESIEKGIKDANLKKLNSNQKAKDIYGKWL